MVFVRGWKNINHHLVQMKKKKFDNLEVAVKYPTTQEMWLETL